MPKWRSNKSILALAFQVLASTSVFGQGAQYDLPQTATIRGTVVNSVTHEPIGRALVSSPDNRYATMTDTEGHFEFTVSGVCGNGNVGQSPCPTTLMARKPGFIELHHWQTVVPGSEVTISLKPEALIVGHVLLPSSESPDRIRVELYRRQVSEGRGHWVNAGSTSTRSNGEFRFAELAAGSYKLLTRELLDRDPLTFSPGGQLFGYPPIYFPNASDFAGGEAIQLSPGKTFQAEISLAKHPYYTVKILVINAAPGTGLNINVSVQGHKGPGFSLGYNLSNQAIEGLLPNGTYNIEASSYGQIAATGSITITVKAGPVEGPRMTLAQNGSINVNVKEEFTSTEDLNTGGPVVAHFVSSRRAERGPRRYLNVYLEPANDFGEGRGASLRAPSGPDDDSLAIDNVQPGRYWVRVNSSRGYAASVTSGGIDLQHQPLIVPPAGSTDPIEITMRDDWAEIECAVEGVSGTANAEQQIIQGPQQSSTHVYLIPQPDSPGEFRDLWIPPGGEATAQMPPGLYWVLTLDSAQPELEYHDAEVMRAYESKGQVIRLAAGQKQHLRVQVISAGE
jgi:hypothetical protein